MKLFQRIDCFVSTRVVSLIRQSLIFQLILLRHIVAHLYLVGSTRPCRRSSYTNLRAQLLEVFIYNRRLRVALA